MKQLRIYFKNEDLTSISWCYLVEGIKQEEGNDFDDSFKQCSQSASDTILLVPQNWVYETSIDISSGNSKQLLSAAAYQLEEQLAEDVDDLHFAQGKAVNDRVPFVVIKHDKMISITEFEKTHHLNAAIIVTELSLCPQPDTNEINVIQHEQHYLLKSSNVDQSAVCGLSQLEFFINHFKSQSNDVIINQLDQNQWLCSNADFTDSINLKQKNYAQGYAWQAIAVQFTLPIILLILITSFWMFNTWQENNQLADRISDVKQQQSKLIKRSITNYSETSSAKTALIKALQKQQGEGQQSGFIFEFYQFLNAKNSVKSINLNKVDYRNNKLTIDVSSNNLQQLDQLIISMKKEFKVTVSQMDSSNNESQGRFILERK